MLHSIWRNFFSLLVLGSLLWAADEQKAPSVPPKPTTTAAPTVSNEPKISPSPSLPTTTRGQTVTVTGENLPAQGVKVLLRTGKEEKGNSGRPIDAVVDADKKSLSFKLPKDSDFITGRYLVFVSFDSKELPVPGDLTVAPDESPKVRVDSIYPATDYGNDKDKAYDFEISGENLAQAPNDNIIEVVGHGPLTVGNAEECKSYAQHQKYQKICLSYEPGMEGKKLTVLGYHPAHYEGPVDFRVHTPNSISETKRVMFSSVSETGLRALATFVSLLIAFIVLLLVWKGIGVYKIAGVRYSPLSAFFLDKESNSYSLSKFQLVAWTAVAVFGYVYLLCCQTLIQWNFSFPSIPSGWPTLLGVSAGATVAAVGITSTRGSKGAGPLSPSMADFISSGGLVLSDRFQFFVWTLVGCAGFLFLILRNDPSKLTELPDVPSGFLYLMGISAAGYLGGKVVRLPGPVVKELVVSSVVPGVPGTSTAQLTINLKGENLSSNASVKVDDKDLRMTDQFQIECVTPQDQPPDPSFCSEIKLTLKEADNYLEGQHKLILTNKDGQMAVSSFPIDPLTISPVNDLSEGTTPVDVTVNGANFAVGLTAVWKNAAQQETTIGAAQVQIKTDKQLIVTLVPGPAGKGTLTLVSPRNLRAHTDVNVRGAGAGAATGAATTIDSVSDVASGADPTSVTVTGTNFSDGTTAEWKDSSGATSSIGADKIQRTSANQLVITIPPPAKGNAVLTLITPAAARVSKTVTVS
jgi:hypothetical protein